MPFIVPESPEPDSGHAPGREKFPMQALLAMAGLTLLILGGAVWIVGRFYGDSLTLVRTELRLQAVIGKIMLFDEGLTMSARMAATTGDLKWEARYREFEPQLDAAIQEAIRIAPEVYIGSSAITTNAANQALVNMENHSFELVAAGRRIEAMAVLSSQEYDTQKALYAKGMNASNQAVAHRVQDLLVSQHRKLRAMGAIAIGVLFLLVLIWMRIVRLIRRYLATNSEAKIALARANRDLEERVQLRTREILAGKQALEEEMIRRERAEVVLRQAQKLESIGQLAAGIAHEINTPSQYVGDNLRFLQETSRPMVSALELFGAVAVAARSGPIPLELLQRAEGILRDVDVEYAKTEVPKALEQALEGVARVTAIVRAMKDFAHPDTTESALVNLNEAIASTITVTRNEWKYVADLDTDFDPSLPLVPCFAGEFNQVILNLIVNAAHAIGDVNKDEKAGKGRITVSTRRTGDHVEIRVADTGSGIPDHILPRIFDPFFTTKEVGKGSGQGLALAYNIIVGRHKGTIDVETRPGHGSTFLVRLPIATAQT